MALLENNNIILVIGLSCYKIRADCFLMFIIRINHNRDAETDSLKIGNYFINLDYYATENKLVYGES